MGDRINSDKDLYAGAALGFDEAAITFDRDEEGNILLRWMRERSARTMERAFPRDTMLLEMGSGTGIEASRLARSGRRVVLTDVSTEMLQRASEKVRAVRDDALVGAHHLPASRIGRLVSEYGKASFDGAYSSFGALNCEPDLSPIANGLAALVKPGGHVVFSIINRYCPTEILWYALHLDFRNATRRLGGPVLARGVPGGSLSVETWYYTPGDFRRAFERSFRVVSVRALPLVLPPPYLAHHMARFPRLFRLLGKADDALAGLPLLRAMGDHFLIELQRG